MSVWFVVTVHHVLNQCQVRPHHGCRSDRAANQLQSIPDVEADWLASDLPVGQQSKGASESVERIWRQGISHDPLQCWQWWSKALGSPQDRGDALGVRAQEEDRGDGRGGAQETSGEDLQSFFFPLILPPLCARISSPIPTPRDAGQVDNVPQMPGSTTVGLQVRQQPVASFFPSGADHSRSSPAAFPSASPVPVPFFPLQDRQQQAAQGWWRHSGRHLQMESVLSKRTGGRRRVEWKKKIVHKEWKKREARKLKTKGEWWRKTGQKGREERDKRKGKKNKIKTEINRYTQTPTPRGWITQLLWAPECCKTIPLVAVIHHNNTDQKQSVAFVHYLSLWMRRVAPIQTRSQWFASNLQHHSWLGNTTVPSTVRPEALISKPHWRHWLVSYCSKMDNTVVLECSSQMDQPPSFLWGLYPFFILAVLQARLWGGFLLLYGDLKVCLNMT